MSGIFLKLLNMSVSAGWLILAVVLVRFVFKKSPKWINCILWALVAIRLICPFSIESSLSLLPDTKVVDTIENTGRPYIRSGITTVDDTVNAYLGKQYKDNTASKKESVKSVTDPIHVIAVIWLIGVLGFMTYAFISYFNLQRKVSESVRLRENIFLCDRIQTPFILGVIKPRIFLPSDMNEVQIENVIAHEKAHIIRRDYIWKPLGYILLAVYWFNPLCYLAYILLCRDIEMACDEKVIGNMDIEAKKAYSMVLLTCSVSGKKISVCPLAFGEVGVKERIKGILNYKKPTLWVLIVSAIVCIVAAVCFMTNPKSGTYKIGIRIPAHSEAGLYYSEHEISPQKRTVSFEVGQDVGDTKIQLTPVEVNEENAYDELTYVTPGLASKVNAEKGAWFKVGVYASNESDEEITIFVTVSNVVVRIASAAEQETVEDFVEVQTPLIDLEVPTGADGSMSSYNLIFGEQQISYDNAFEIIDRVVVGIGLENAYAWNNTADFKEDADILIKMAADSTGEFEVYGISSAEYGDYGMLLNDIINGEDNWNYVYEPWFYTGAPNDQPTLEWTDDGELIFSYICKDENGEETWYHRVVDCGYDTGHMELMP